MELTTIFFCFFTFKYFIIFSCFSYKQYITEYRLLLYLYLLLHSLNILLYFRILLHMQYIMGSSHHCLLYLYLSFFHFNIFSCPFLHSIYNGVSSCIFTLFISALSSIKYFTIFRFSLQLA